MTGEERTYGKSDVGFRRLGSSLEPDTVDLGFDQTPTDRFFVCNAGTAPDIDRGEWHMRVDGDAATTPIELEWDDLNTLEQVTVVSCLECAGNGRRFFNLVAEHGMSPDPINTQWTLGGLGLASWRGPRLSTVLALASPSTDAAFVGPSGLDIDNDEGEPVRMSLPMEKAIHEDTIVALEMNGAPLGRAHGAPARLIVPGWVGAYSVKWLDRLELSSSWIDSYRSNEYYVLRDTSGEPTGPATSHPTKSQLRLEWNAEIPAGRTEIMGYARSGVAPITGVEWAIDDEPWRPADLLEDLGRWAWRPFGFQTDLSPGLHHIRTRATDETGMTQPDTQPVHRDGVLWHAVIPHPVTVVE